MEQAVSNASGSLNEIEISARHRALGKTLPVSVGFRNVYKIECHDADGNLKWVEEVVNLVTTVGSAYLLSTGFKAGTPSTSWFVGLYKGTGTLAAADTSASHAGWTDSTDYSNATRPALTLGSITGTVPSSVDNSGSPAVFTINATATILGAYLIDNSTKGGTTGTLFGEAAFGASKGVTSGDTLTVTVTLTAQ